MNRRLGIRLRLWIGIAGCLLLAAGCAAEKSKTKTDSGDTAAGIVLEGNGLGAANFGEPQKDVEFALTDLLGVPDSKDTSPPDCGDLPLDRAIWWGPLRVGFRDGEFVHYLYVPPEGIAEPFATAKGISPGSTLEQMEKAYGSDLAEGPESLVRSYLLKTDAGDIQAVFSDAIPPPGTPAKVYGMAAGTTCN